MQSGCFEIKVCASALDVCGETHCVVINLLCSLSTLLTACTVILQDTSEIHREKHYIGPGQTCR